MNLDNYLFGSTVILAFVACSALGVVFVRRLRKWKSLTHHHEVMGYLFPVAGSIYGVLLGLVVVNAITVFEKARDTVNDETSDLLSIYMLADTLPQESRQKIREFCRNYTESVLQFEWDSMDRGVPHPPSRHHMTKLASEIISISKSQPGAASQLVDVSLSLWKERRMRIDTAMRSIPLVEWVTLCAGAVLVVFFSYMFAMDNLWLQLTGTVMLSTLIALNLYLVVLFGHPFSGDLKVSNYPFQHALELFDELDAASR